MTLPSSRLSRPLVRSTMSSAWSQGTFCRRSVTLPCTVSLTTMFWPLVSASNCSTARVSMSWKLSVRRSPLYSFFSCAAAAALEHRLSHSGGRRARLQLERVRAVGLGGGLLVVAGGGDDDACAGRRARNIEGVDGGGEIGDVVAARLVGADLRVREIHHESATLALEAGLRPGAADGLHDDPAAAVRRAAGIDLPAPGRR